MKVACVLLPLVSAYQTPMATNLGNVGGIALTSRRALLGAVVGTPLAALVTLPAEAAVVVPQNERIDALTVALQQSRADFDSAPQLLEDKKWDAVRKLTQNLLPLLTFSGYRGESVKSRANAWLDAGEVEKSKAIAARRTAIASNINRLEIGIYAAQTGNKKTMLSMEEMQNAANSIIKELDGLLPLMGCEQRWQSGKCEILPKERSMTDVRQGAKSRHSEPHAGPVFLDHLSLSLSISLFLYRSPSLPVISTVHLQGCLLKRLFSRPRAQGAVRRTR